MTGAADREYPPGRPATALEAYEALQAGDLRNPEARAAIFGHPSSDPAPRFDSSGGAGRRPKPSGATWRPGNDTTTGRGTEPYEAEVRGYVADCLRLRGQLDPAYHPTANGAVNNTAQR